MPINSFLYPGVKVPLPFSVTNSLRFNNGSSDFLNKDASSGNRRTFTISQWIKRSDISAFRVIFGSAVDANNECHLYFNSSDQLSFEFVDGGSNAIVVKTNRLFRDPSAWYHIVCAVDTTQATDSNRVKLYINGTQETSLATATYPSQNLDVDINVSGSKTQVGAYNATGSESGFFGGYMAEVVLIDGQQLDPTSFGEFDEDSGIWKPIDVSGLTFGTN